MFGGVLFVLMEQAYYEPFEGLYQSLPPVETQIPEGHVVVQGATPLPVRQLVQDLFDNSPSIVFQSLDQANKTKASHNHPSARNLMGEFDSVSDPFEGLFHRICRTEEQKERMDQQYQQVPSSGMDGSFDNSSLQRRRATSDWWVAS
jgi:hypothetical protein